MDGASNLRFIPLQNSDSTPSDRIEAIHAFEQELLQKSPRVHAMDDMKSKSVEMLKQEAQLYYWTHSMFPTHDHGMCAMFIPFGSSDVGGSI